MMLSLFPTVSVACGWTRFWSSCLDCSAEVFGAGYAIGAWQIVSDVGPRRSAHLGRMDLTCLRGVCRRLSMSC